MKIVSTVESSGGRHTADVSTNNQSKSLTIAPKPDGYGSSINGGELLFLALATCFCNDLYREAAKRHIAVTRVRVEVSGEFGQEGQGASNIQYSAHVSAQAPETEILALIRHTDSVTEIQNTLRNSAPVILASSTAESC